MTGACKFRFIPGILYSMFTLLLLSGCIAENTDDCFKGIPLKVNLPADIPQETIKDMSLYVFDDKDLLLDILPVNNMEPVILNYPGIPTLHCVCLCNAQDGSMLLCPLKKGDSCSDCFISLKPFASARAGEQSMFTSPADLMHGELKIENKTTSGHVEDQIMDISRMTASINITLRGLQKLIGTEDGNYSLVIHETYSRMDFSCNYGGDPASYCPAMTLAANKDFEVSMCRLFPTINGKGITMDIYHNQSLLKSITTDGSGTPIVPIVGKTTNLLLNFEGSVGVEIEITGWGETVVWKEYN